MLSICPIGILRGKKNKISGRGWTSRLELNHNLDIFKLEIKNYFLKMNFRFSFQLMETQIFHYIIFVLTARITNFCKIHHWKYIFLFNFSLPWTVKYRDFLHLFYVNRCKNTFSWQTNIMKTRETPWLRSFTWIFILILDVEYSLIRGKNPIFLFFWTAGCPISYWIAFSSKLRFTGLIRKFKKNESFKKWYKRII